MAVNQTGGRGTKHISVRVTPQEKEIIDKYADFCGCSVSDAILNAFWQKLEDEHDLKVIREYERQKSAGTLKLISWDNVREGLDIS
jgi:uncharacterized protein (DUF1778 family)